MQIITFTLFYYCTTHVKLSDWLINIFFIHIYINESSLGYDLYNRVCQMLGGSVLYHNTWLWSDCPTAVLEYGLLTYLMGPWDFVMRFTMKVLFIWERLIILSFKHFTLTQIKYSNINYQMPKYNQTATIMTVVTWL